jgi:hypothetical protein
VHRREHAIAADFPHETNGTALALGVRKEINPMRTSLAALIVCSLIPASAFADDVAPGQVRQPPRIVVLDDKGQPVDTTALVRPATQASPQGDADVSGYAPPHFVPYTGGAIPSYAHIATKPNIGFAASGLAILSTSYLVSLVYALSTCGAQMDCRAGSGWLYLPIVGPFITAVQSSTTGGAALAAFDGGVQVLGASLAIASVLAPSKFVMWQDKTAKLSIAPTTVGAGTSAGLAVTLTHL